MAVLLLALILASASSLCVKERPAHLFCDNEIMFDEMFSDIESLTLNGGIINKILLARKFPNLKRIIILKSDYLFKQCTILYQTNLQVEGCETGKKSSNIR